jgi:hypothetical protein
MGIARAEAYEGRLDEAVRDGKAAYEEMAAFDIFDSSVARNHYGRILVIAGRNDEALAVLRDLIASPLEETPRGMAIDPVWGRLKGDPRFQKILDSVRPL